MKLIDYRLGFADAEKELLLTPEIFESAFYDPKNIENKLLHSWSFILSGRKGVGKSAFNSRIQYLAKNENEIVAVPLMLDDFPYPTFAKADCDNNIEGTKNTMMLGIFYYYFESINIYLRK